MENSLDLYRIAQCALVARALADIESEDAYPASPSTVSAMPTGPSRARREATAL